MVEERTAETQPAVAEDLLEEKEEISLADELKNVSKELAEEPKDTKVEAVKPEEVKTEEPKEPEAAQGIEPPTHWSKEHKETFAKIAPEHKQFVLERYKAMEGDYTRKTQEIASERKAVEAIKTAFEPIRGELQASGIDEANAIQRLVNAHIALQRDPVNTLKLLANQYGANLSQLTDGGGEEFQDPDVVQLRNELRQRDLKIQELERNFNGFVQTNQQREQETIASVIEGFASRKDASGNAQYPLLDELRVDMQRFVVTDPRPAQTPAQMEAILKDAYEKALWANPETRQKALAEQKKREFDLQEKERLNALNKAKRASTSLNGAGGEYAATSGGSLADDLRAAARELS